MTHLLTAVAASQTLPSLPAWSKACFVVAAAWWLGLLVGSIRARTARMRRRLYWIGWGGVAVLCGVAMSARGWAFGAWGMGIVAVGAVGWAVKATNYLVIGGRVITASRDQRKRYEGERAERLSAAASQD